MHYEINGLIFDQDFKVWSGSSRQVKLSYNEQKALSLLVNCNNEFLDKRELDKAIWKDVEVTDGAVRKLMSGLRSKLSASDDEPLDKCIKNTRGKGYSINYKEVDISIIEESLQQVPSSQTPLHPIESDNGIVAARRVGHLLFLLLLVLSSFAVISYSSKNEYLPIGSKTAFEMIHSDHKQVVTYTKYLDTYYMLEYANNTYEIVSSRFGFESKVYSVEGYNLDGMSISPLGYSTLRKFNSESCEFFVFSDLFQTVKYSLPCVSSHSIYSVDWDSPSSFIFTTRASENTSAKPFRLAIDDGHVSALSELDIDYGKQVGFGDYFVKQTEYGLLMLRFHADSTGEILLVTSDEKFVIDTYSHLLQSVAYKDGSIYYFDRAGRLVTVYLPDVLKGDSPKIDVVMSNQSYSNFFPKFLDDELHFYSGLGVVMSLNSDQGYGTEDSSIYAANGRFVDVEQVDHGTVVSLIRNSSGYKFDFISVNGVIESNRIITDRRLSSIAVVNGVVYVGGKDGLFYYQDGLNIIDKRPVYQLVASGNSLMISFGNEGVRDLYEYDIESELFNLVVNNIFSLVAYQNSYAYVESASLNVLSSKEYLGKLDKHKMLIAYDGQLVVKEDVNGQTNLVGFESGTLIDQFPSSIQNWKVFNLNGSRVFLVRGHPFNTLIKAVNSL